MTRRPTVAAAALIVSALVANTHADEALPRDPGNEYGQFDNGLHYIIRHNANPPGRVALYLHVKTGALNESDAQNGLAHFLEHMAFNGSTHFPPGRLLPLLGGLGMTFGADTNAHTNLWETVFKLTLPDTQPKHIDLACQIFGDYAGGLTLSDEGINNERKIILEEYRTRQGAAQRLGKLNNKDVFAGTRLATHDIIGNADLIKTFPPDQFRDYYDRWYRPENMTLIVVGDVKADDILPAAKQWLAVLQPRTPKTPPQTAGLTPTTRPRAFVYSDPEQVTADVSLTAIEPGEPPIATYEAFRRDALRGIASAIVDRRFHNMISTGQLQLRRANVGIDTFQSEAMMAEANAVASPTDWNLAVTALVTEIHRALQYGFDASEMKLVERGMLADAEHAVTAEATRDTVAVVNEMARAVGENQPLLSAAQELDLLKRVVGEATVEELARTFTAAFNDRNINYVVSLPANKPEVKLPTSDDVTAAADAAWSATVAPPATQAASDTLLAAEPTPGAVTHQETDADLGITTLTFANGVVMHHKFSDYKKDAVLVSLTLPGGQLEETAENRGVGDLASAILGRPATGRHSSIEIRDLMTGKNVSVGGAIGRDALAVSVAGTNADLPTGLQLAYALLTDPKLEPATVAEWKRNQLTNISKMDRDPRGQLRRAMADTLMGGEPRFAPLTAANVDALTAPAAEAWFKRIADHAAIEVAVVGDIPLDQAVAQVARYVGSLPPREQKFDALDALRTIRRASGPFRATVAFDSVTPQAMAVAGFVDCEDDNLDRRPLSVAAKILTNRMIDRIRKQEQLVYSISASNAPGHGLPGSGTFAAGSMTDPKNGDKLADVILEMVTDFAKTGPTDDELAEAKKQVLTEVSSAMRDPAWWMGQIAETAYRHRNLADLKSLPQVFDTYTKEQVQAVVAKYMTPDRIVRYVMTPKAAATPATQP